MNRKTTFSVVATTLLLGWGALIFQGCVNEAREPSKSVTAPNSAETPDESLELDHGHVPGAHGGFIISIGRDSYHAEAIFEKDGAISLYMLGADETRINEVENQDLTAYVKTSSTAEAAPMQLKPEPQEGDTAGKTSRFSGTLPESLWGVPVEVTIPVIRIGTDRFRLGFNSAIQSTGDPMMPGKVTSEEEQDLYLTPAGLYTQADIEANNNMTGSQKFVGFMAAHDMNPKAGDKICPITETKANPKCSWIVGGQSYEFCCPPCVDEFVKLAKTEPDSVKPPQEYVKK